MQELRIFDSLTYQNEHYRLEKSITQIKNNKLSSYSTVELISTVNKLSHGLLSAGYKKGDKFSIAAFNSTSWSIIDLAAAQIGMIHVPLYPNASSEDYEFIIKQAGVKLFFAGNDEIAAKAANLVANTELKLFHLEEGKSNFWKDFLKDYDQEDLDKIEEIKKTIDVDDLATIIYTSGTTGNPKGVMLSHKNIMSNAQDVAEAIKIAGKEYRVLSFLPLCHIFERTALYTYLYMGMSIYYPENLDNLGDDMRLVKPHFFTTVPRVMEKIFEKIESKAATLPPTKQKIFNWALKEAKNNDVTEKPGFLGRLKMKVADKLVFSKWREAVGGYLQFIVSGAAPMQPQLVQIFTAAGIPVLEAYGLTEASPGITMTKYDLDDIKPGSVGKKLTHVEVKIGDDGEVLAKGPNIMMGYFENKEATDNTIKDGWLLTGDLGRIDEEGNLYITGRKKELFKTSGGKYIAPQKIENILKSSALVDQVMVVGDARKYPAALIVPSHEMLESTLKEKLPSPLNTHGKVRAIYEQIIEENSRHFGRYEQIKNFYIVDEPWTVETGELTPTMKMKRKFIEKKYYEQIDALY